MVARLATDFWAVVARIILRNRILILLGIVLVTVFLAMQWKNMRFTRSEANLLPDDHPYNQQYNQFLDLFGEEGNVLALGLRDSALFEAENFNRWNRLSKQLAAYPEISFVISTDNLMELVKDNEGQKFVLKPWLEKDPASKTEVDSLTSYLFNNLPFYESLIFNKESGTIRTVAYMDQDIVNTNVRKDFILKDLTNLIDQSYYIL